MIMIVAVVYVMLLTYFFGNVDDDRQAGQTQSCALLFTILPPHFPGPSFYISTNSGRA